MTLHHTLYRKLTVLIPTLPHVPEYVKSKVPGLMDLNLDLLSCNDELITAGGVRVFVSTSLSPVTGGITNG